MSLRIVLFGGSGFLGSCLKRNFTKFELSSPTHSQLNLFNSKKTLEFIDSKKPDLIIYSAGITKIDFAENNKNLAYMLNFEIPKLISNFASKNKTPILYISTDAVFDGYKRKYKFSEKDSPFAKSIYGQSKLNGEEAILNSSSNNLVLRLITLFGDQKGNFLSDIINKLKHNQEILGIYDQIQNPLNVDIAVNCIDYCIRNKLRGVYNLGALDYDSNYDFLIKVATEINLNTKLIKEVSFEEFFRNKIAHRKKRSVLVTDKFNKVSKNKFLKSIDKSISYLNLK